MIKPEQVFPTILIILDICAGIYYLIKTGDMKKCIYWLAAATLTITVTY